MSRFENVTVVKAANVYFDGGVTSRTIEFPDGSTRTLGFMLPGNYTFDTGKAEFVEIQSGELRWRLCGESEWQDLIAGQSFHVPGNNKFELQVTKATDYVCSFLDE
ncbi:MAG: pyrimidine/purine nucleoside phosphorylase [Planctomycetaceae bacterium]